MGIRLVDLYKYVNAVPPDYLYHLADRALKDLAKILQELFRRRFQQQLPGFLWSDHKPIKQLLVDNIKIGPMGKARILSDGFNEWDVSLLAIILEYIKGDEVDNVSDENLVLRSLKILHDSVANKAVHVLEVEEFKLFYEVLIELVEQGLKLNPCTITVNIEKLPSLKKLTSGDNDYESRGADLKSLVCGRQYLAEGRLELAINTFSSALENDKVGDSLRGEIYIAKFTTMQLQQMNQLRQRGWPCGTIRDNVTTRAIASDAVNALRFTPGAVVAHKYLEKYFLLKGDHYRALNHLHYSNKVDPQRMLATVSGLIQTAYDSLKNHPLPNLLSSTAKLSKEACKILESKVDVLTQSDESLEEMNKCIDQAINLFEKAAGHQHSSAMAKFAVTTLSLIVLPQPPTDISKRPLQNIFRAWTSLKMISGDSIPTPIFGDSDTKLDNNRVGYAKFMVGLLSELGFESQVKKNLSETVKCYKLAASKHNIPWAAFNLALLYSEGIPDLPKDGQQARFYFQQAIHTNNKDAMCQLAILYLSEFELLKARRLLDKVFAQNVEVGEQHREWFYSRFTLAKVRGLDKMLEELDMAIANKYEFPCQLSTKGMTLLERAKRAEMLGFEWNLSFLLEMNEIIFDLKPKRCFPQTDFEDSSSGGENDNSKEFARCIAKIEKDFAQVYDIVTRTEIFSKKRAVEICNMLYSCFEAAPSIKFALELCSYYDTRSRRVISSLMGALRKQAVSERGDDSLLKQEMKSTILHIVFKPIKESKTEKEMKLEEEDSLEMVKAAWEKFPHCVLYYVWLCEFVNFSDNPKSEHGVAFLNSLCDKGNSHFPNNSVFLYTRAYFEYHWGIAEKEENFDGSDAALLTALKSLELFLEVTPQHHPLYPMAAYLTAWSYHLTGLNDFNKCWKFIISDLEDGTPQDIVKLLGKHKEGYTLSICYGNLLKAIRLAEESEKAQLPCFPLTTATKHLKQKVSIVGDGMYVQRMRMLDEWISSKAWAGTPPPSSTHDLLTQMLAENQYDELVKYFEGFGWGNHFSKPYLLGAYRVYCIQGLRHRFNSLKEDSTPGIVTQESLSSFVTYTTMPWETFRISVEKSMTQRLTIEKDINPVAPQPPPPGHLQLTIIDVIVVELEFLYTIAEDPEGSIIHLVLERDAPIARLESSLRLEFGTTMTIVNPKYSKMRNNEDGCLRLGPSSGIGENKCKLVLTGRARDLCRFCSGRNSKRECGKCKRRYCSDTCQKNDWKILRHKYVCKYEDEVAGCYGTDPY